MRSTDAGPLILLFLALLGWGFLLPALAGAGNTSAPAPLRVDRVGIVFTDLDADVGAGRPTIAATVEWTEGPFDTPTIPAPGGEVAMHAHLNLAISGARFFRWDGDLSTLGELHPADIDQDGVVGAADLAAVTAAWGQGHLERETDG